MANPTYAVHGTYQEDSGNPFLTYLSSSGGTVFQIDKNGNISVQNGATLAGLGTPLIVAVSSNTNLAFGSFGTPITLVAAAGQAGTYRLTISGTVKTTITTATSWLFTAAYTDDIHSQTPTVSTSSTMTANATETGSITFRSTGTAAITITPTAASSDAGAIAYYAVLERLI